MTDKNKTRCEQCQCSENPNSDFKQMKIGEEAIVSLLKNFQEQNEKKEKPGLFKRILNFFV